MPPYTIGSSQTTQAKAHKPIPVVPRIIPAVPLAFSRPSQGPQAATPPLEALPSRAVHEMDYSESIKDEELDNREPLPQVPLTPESRDSAAEGTNGTESQDAVNGSTDTVATDPSPETGPSLKSKAGNQTLALSERTPTPPKTSTRIRELPPPFYPSTESFHASNSATSAGGHQNTSGTLKMHHPRPNSNRIVFGGFPDSSNSSPAPPSGMMAYPPPPPLGYIPPSYGPPPFFPPGHALHLSDPNAGLIYPIGMPPTNGYGYRRDQQLPSVAGRQQQQQQQWMVSEGPMPFPFRHHEPCSPHHMYTPTNGAGDPYSRSGSQASTRTQDKDTIRSHHQPRSDIHIANENFINQPKDTSQESSLCALRDYLCSQFSVPDFADHLLEVRHGVGDSNGMILPVHGVIVSRSPVLMSSIIALGPMTSNPMPRVIKLVIPSNHFNSFAIKEAVKFLYGGRLLTEHGLDQGLPPFHEKGQHSNDFNLAQERMVQAIAYTVAGQALEVSPIVSAGTGVIRKLLRWDTVEKALCFSLEGYYLPDKNEFARELPERPPNSHANHSTRDSYKKKLLNSTVEFIVYTFPKEFALDTNAPQLVEPAHLPITVDSRPITHHSRLSQIRFGELPPEAQTIPSLVTTLLSSILLSLPYLTLKRLLEHYTLGGRLGWEKVVEVMHSVIEEREKRRQKIAASKASLGMPPIAEDPLWQNVLYEERLEPCNQHASGFRLSRHLVTVDQKSSDVTGI